MGLMDLVRKAINTETATAIPAIPATETPKPPMRIATIAPIAVATTDNVRIDWTEPLEQDRVKTFEAKGIPTDDAKWLASKLTIRDDKLDDRKSCAECQSFYGSRCIQRREPFGGGGVEVLHRCDGFKQNEWSRFTLETGVY